MPPKPTTEAPNWPGLDVRDDPLSNPLKKNVRPLGALLNRLKSRNCVPSGLCFPLSTCPAKSSFYDYVKTQYTFSRDLSSQIALGCASHLDVYEAAVKSAISIGRNMAGGYDAGALKVLSLPPLGAAFSDTTNHSISPIAQMAFEAIGVLDMLHREQLFANSKAPLPSFPLTAEAISHINGKVVYTPENLSYFNVPYKPTYSACHLLRAVAWRQTMNPVEGFSTTDLISESENLKTLAQEDVLRICGGIEPQHKNRKECLEQMVANLSYGMLQLKKSGQEHVAFRALQPSTEVFSIP